MLVIFSLVFCLTNVFNLKFRNKKVNGFTTGTEKLKNQQLYINILVKQESEKIKNLQIQQRRMNLSAYKLLTNVQKLKNSTEYAKEINKQVELYFNKLYELYTQKKDLILFLNSSISNSTIIDTSKTFLDRLNSSNRREKELNSNSDRGNNAQYLLNKLTYSKLIGRILLFVDRCQIKKKRPKVHYESLIRSLFNTFNISFFENSKDFLKKYPYSPLSCKFVHLIKMTKDFIEMYAVDDVL
jgi:hypothetical protein